MCQRVLNVSVFGSPDFNWISHQVDILASYMHGDTTSWTLREPFFFRRTKFKTLRVLLQFSDNYPEGPILLELKSKTLPPALLAKLTEICDQEIKKFVGRRQVNHTAV